MIWLYFFLLLFEGSLRKWVVPGLSTPLLIIRDPVALYGIFLAFKYKLFKSNVHLSVLSFLTLVAFMATLALGHGNLMVALFGARIILIHFTFIFVIAEIFTKEDVIKMGKMMLLISLPMIILIGLQFYSPQSAWVNRGIGGSMEGGGFSGAQGYFRPPGTFSFTVGNVQFWSLLACFIFYFWFNPDKINKLLLIASTFALVASIPLSISRGLLFQIILSFMFTMIAVSGKPKYVSKLLMILVFGAMIILILKDTSFFMTATGAFTERFETANEAEGGLESMFLDRFLGGLISAFTDTDNMPFFGLGIGMGTNVGAQLLYGSSQKFLIAEGEWGKIVGELGPLIGVIVIFVRSHFTFKTLSDSLSAMRKGEILPWMIMSYAFLILLQGQWSQPTSAGFAVIMGGLILAALRDADKQKLN